jgi:hypothetical protein
MLELESFCHSPLEGNTNRASGRLGRLIPCYYEGTCRSDQHAIWTIRLI